MALRLSNAKKINIYKLTANILIKQNKTEIRILRLIYISDVFIAME